jgi:hypothetical protein
VPHDSHGITLRECVAHDVQATAYWWDIRDDDRPGTYQPATHDSLWERCVASDVWAGKTESDRFRMAGFSFGEGRDLSNSCVGCVAVGVRNWISTMTPAQVSGFHWPESGGGATWIFQDCLAHNVGGSGIFNWENDQNFHMLERFTAYYNGKSGIDHGAYSNHYHHRDCVLYANRRAGIGIAAISRINSATPQDATPISFENIFIDGAGLTRWGIESLPHHFSSPEDQPILVSKVTVQGCRQASYFECAQENSISLRIVDSRLAPPEFFFDDHAPAATIIRVEKLNGVPGAFLVRRKDRPGTMVAAWNARRG